MGGKVMDIHDWLTEEGRKLYYSGCQECRRMFEEAFDAWRGKADGAS